MSRYTKSQANKSLLFLTEIDRLQDEVDNFTSKLEILRRQNIAQENSIPELFQKRQKRTMSLQKYLPNPREEKKLHWKVKTLQNRVQHERSKLNSIEAGNDVLKDKINILRREKAALLEMHKEMEIEIVKRSQEAEKCNKVYNDSIKIEEKYKKRCLNLKQKAEVDLNILDQGIKSLTMNIEEDERLQKVNLQQIQNTFKQETNQNKVDQVDPISPLNSLYEQWKQFCYDKKQQIDKYQLNIKILSDAFNQIKEATGIQDIEEIVINFIKSQEQNYGLVSFINSLNSELDDLEEKYYGLMQNYELIKKNNDEQHSYRITTASQLNQQISYSRQRRNEQVKNLDALSSQISFLQEPVDYLTQTFRSKGFISHICKSVEKDEEFVLNEKNVLDYIGELEDQIYQLVELSAINNNISNPEFQSVGFEQEQNDTSQIALIKQQFTFVEEQDIDVFVPMSTQQFREKAVEMYRKRE